MKELSIEEKAKRYDEAIEKFDVIINLNTVKESGTIFADDVRKIFPELVKSEDERIRKEIMELVMQPTWKTEKEFHRRNELCTWLEKQGEQSKKHDICDTCDEKDSCISPCCVKLVEEQGEQKSNPVLDIEIPFGAKDSELQEAFYHIPEGFHAEIESNRVVIKRGEQKPAEWSKEDEIGFNDALWAIQQAGTIAKDENNMGNIWYAENWLKSIKERVQPQPQQEWSDEDKRNYFVIEQALFRPNAYGTKKEKKDALDWLKSLRPQNRWKPSDEQINALSVAIKHGQTDDPDALKKLLEQLKKLKEG